MKKRKLNKINQVKSPKNQIFEAGENPRGFDLIFLLDAL
jgi:hypothetical protein